MITTRLYYLSLALILPVCFGCSDDRPAGMPPLYPVTLTFTLDGQPLDAAFVMLHAEDGPNTAWAVGGTTDAEGRAIIVTHGQFRGAPAGKFKVCVVKVEGADSSTDPDPYAGTVLEGTGSVPSSRPRVIHFVDSLFGNPETTPLSIEILPQRRQTANMTFDVHKPQ